MGHPGLFSCLFLLFPGKSSCGITIQRMRSLRRGSCPRPNRPQVGETGNVGRERRVWEALCSSQGGRSTGMRCPRSLEGMEYLILSPSHPALLKRGGNTPRPKSKDSSSEEPPWSSLLEILAVFCWIYLEGNLGPQLRTLGLEFPHLELP